MVVKRSTLAITVSGFVSTVECPVTAHGCLQVFDPKAGGGGGGGCLLAASDFHGSTYKMTRTLTTAGRWALAPQAFTGHLTVQGTVIMFLTCWASHTMV